MNGTTQNFQSEVLDFKGTVLVDFWAEWCGPCHMLSPVIEEVSKEKTLVKIVKVDVDKEVELATKYNITSIPAVLIFKDGQLTNTIVGFHQKEEYLKALL